MTAARLWNWMRRSGAWLRDWPCAHGRHEWGLFRPGGVMWWRECRHCNLADMEAFPPRKGCDVDYYENVYMAAAARSDKTYEDRRRSTIVSRKDFSETPK